LNNNYTVNFAASGNASCTQAFGAFLNDIYLTGRNHFSLNAASQLLVCIKRIQASNPGDIQLEVGCAGTGGRTGQPDAADLRG
jgi:hypothetical protein